jgi:hypothetical protein
VKGDFTRETFRPQRHFWGVLRQQGRVDIDADWNEQVRIARHHDVARTADLVGPSGGPIAGAGFGLTVDAAGAITVGAGRYYVAGVLVENESEVALAAQPDPPAGLPPTGAGLHLAYLDAWDRHVTALDDPTIREVALGGPDTATRVRTVWQVRTRPLPPSDAGQGAAITAAIAALAAARAAGDGAAEAAALQELRDLAAGASCAAPLEPMGGSLSAGTGTMAARANEETQAADPCRFDPAGAGYTRLENRLYRVEVHDAGTDATTNAATAAKFKWSRDNGSMVVSVEEFRDTGGGSRTTELVVRRLGLDKTQELKQDDWIEIVSDDLIARNEPGQLVQIAQQPDPADRILFLSDAVDIKAPGLHPQVRRWDLPDGGLATVRRSWQELESGIEVTFGAGTYHTGDYWVIPARANTADIEWPPLPEYPGHAPTAGPEQLAPRGIAHWRAPLAALVHDGTRIVASIDLRALFPAATDLLDFAYVGGDGQEPELPSGHVPQPLRVAVTMGVGPVAGVLVRFTAESTAPTTDTLVGAGQTGTTVDVPTRPDGIAAVDWTIDPEVVDHRVIAELLDDCLTPTRAPVIFSTRVNYQLNYLGGDGQEGMPGETIQPLRAWVSAGRWPVVGATVRFSSLAPDGSKTTVQDGPTDAAGIAEYTWTLDTTTPVQRVLAELLDAAGTTVHQAGLAYTANLSLARRVAYTPSGDCADLATATDVQDALDRLCRRQEGGDCTYTIRAGDDLAARWAAIQAAGFDNGAICFAEGTWSIAKPLRLYRKRNVTVHGHGRASVVVVSRGETAFQFEECDSVTFTDMLVEARLETTREGGGAVSMLNCGPVTIERVTVVGPSAPEPVAAGLAVTRGPESKAVGPIRIRDCDLATGEQQLGILVVNGDVIHVEGNTLRASPFPEGIRLQDYLANARYRAAARRQLVDPNPDIQLQPVEKPTTTPGRFEVSRDIRFTVGTSREPVTFRSTMPSTDVWAAIIRETAASPREALSRAVEIADTALRNEGEVAGRRVFRTWFKDVEARWEAIGARGIVVAGQRAENVRIVGNHVAGHLQGISVALSADDRTVYRTGVAVVEGNTIRLPGWALAVKRTEGIFIGNCESAIVDGNMVIVGGGVNSEPSIVADGIRAGGVFGARLLIRGNHIDGAIAGVRVVPIGGPPKNGWRWVASDNVNLGDVCLEAPCEVMEDANVPARRVACAGDRPI